MSKDVVKRKSSAILKPIRRLELYNKFEGKCFYCQHNVRYDEMTVDHRIPLHDGGKNCFDNYICSCGDCNLGKGSLSVKDFNVYIDGLRHILMKMPDFRLFCRHYKITIKRKSRFK